MYHSSLNVFMMNNMPSGMKNRESNEQKVARWPNVSFSSSDMLVQNYVTHDGFHTKQQHFTLSSAPAQRVFLTLKSHKVV